VNFFDIFNIFFDYILKFFRKRKFFLIISSLFLNDLSFSVYSREINYLTVKYIFIPKRGIILSKMITSLRKKIKIFHT